MIARLDGDLTPARQSRLAALGADVTRHLGFIHSVALSLPERSLGKLAALPFISHLSYDGEVKKSDAFTDGSSGAAYARQQYGLTGQGVGVAVLDSGSRIVMDLMNSGNSASRLSAQMNFVPGTVDYTDWCGHGTHVSGIIAGNGAASTGSLFSYTFKGVAPQANLINARVLDAAGGGTVSSVLAGIQWVIDNKSNYNIRVANLSLGHPVSESYKTDPLCQAVEAAWKAGIVVVCAAGNNGRATAYNTAGAPNEGWGTAYGSIQSPGNDPYVITVGATKNMDGVRGDDRIATYSSRGTQPPGPGAQARYYCTGKPDDFGVYAGGNDVLHVHLEDRLHLQLTAKSGRERCVSTSGLISTTEQTTGVLYQTDIDPTFSESTYHTEFLLYLVGHLNGNSGSLRCSGPDAAGKPEPHARHHQGPAHGLRRQVD